MEEKKNMLTYSGLQKLEEELSFLKVTERKRIAEKIKEAREQGDLSENAEYDSAKDEQRDIEARIAEIEEILKHAEIVTQEDMESGRVGIGSRVKLLDKEFNERVEYTIVGSTEANSRKGYISNESPIGAALMGAKRNQVITVNSPAGPVKYKVLSISEAEL